MDRDSPHNAFREFGTFVTSRTFIFGTTNITRNALYKPYEQIQMREGGLFYDKKSNKSPTSNHHYSPNPTFRHEMLSCEAGDAPAISLALATAIATNPR